jgi:hypothetical protein
MDSIPFPTNCSLIATGSLVVTLPTTPIDKSFFDCMESTEELINVFIDRQ